MARILHKSKPANESAFAYFDTMLWVAWLRRCDRDFVQEYPNTKTRLEQNKLADKIIDEIIEEERLKQLSLDSSNQ